MPLFLHLVSRTMTSKRNLLIVMGWVWSMLCGTMPVSGNTTAKWSDLFRLKRRLVVSAGFGNISIVKGKDTKTEFILKVPSVRSERQYRMLNKEIKINDILKQSVSRNAPLEFPMYTHISQEVNGTIDLEDEPWMVLKYYVHGDLSKFINNLQRQLSFDELRVVAKDTLIALKEMHAHGWAHNDLKPNNILVTKVNDQGYDATSELLQVKLIDFGLAVMKNSSGALRHGTLTHASPEMLAYAAGMEGDYKNYFLNHGATAYEASDVWSLGSVLYTAKTRKRLVEYTFDDDISSWTQARAFYNRLERYFVEDEEDLYYLGKKTISEHIECPGLVSSSYQWLFGIDVHAPNRRQQCLDFIELLDCLLQFHAEQRCTIEQALEKSFIASQP